MWRNLQRTSSLVLIALSLHSPSAMAEDTISSPGCVTSCWDDSMYVSLCLNDWVCLCSEAEYQSALFQCLYAQCDTNDFGAAIYSTIKQCADNGINIRLTTIPSKRHEELKRSEEEYAHGNMILDASGVPTESGGLPTASATLPTLSNGGATTTLATVVAPSSTIDSGNTGVESTATPTVPSSEPLEGTPTGAAPIVFTGAAERLEPKSGSNSGGAVVALLAGLYLVY